MLNNCIIDGKVKSFELDLDDLTLTINLRLTWQKWWMNGCMMSL